MSDSNVSVLKQHRQSLEKLKQVDSQKSGARDYKAYGIDPPRNRTPLICVEYPDGTKGLFAKHYLVEVICTSSQYLSLVFTTGIVTLEGENLDTILLEKIQEEEVRSLHTFDSKKHDKPADDEPIIRKITRRSVKEKVG